MASLDSPIPGCSVLHFSSPLCTGVCILLPQLCPGAWRQVCWETLQLPEPGRCVWPPHWLPSERPLQCPPLQPLWSAAPGQGAHHLGGGHSDRKVGEEGLSWLCSWGAQHSRRWPWQLGGLSSEALCEAPELRVWSTGSAPSPSACGSPAGGSPPVSPWRPYPLVRFQKLQPCSSYSGFPLCNCLSFRVFTDRRLSCPGGIV